jgi:hopanoid C-2 methylase
MAKRARLRVEYACDPQRLYARFARQFEATYPNRRVGFFTDYRRGFWKLARQAHRSGQFDTLLGVGLVPDHLIEFSREALRGQQNAAFYSARSRLLTGAY